ncbi:hypothetical protein, partial [Blastomonas fulva]|uniref:hypothetical protein n=1 Tax=Blastomonas fulva TaxID=1550728 RepID=UPI003F70D61F
MTHHEKGGSGVASMHEKAPEIERSRRFCDVLAMSAGAYAAGRAACACLTRVLKTSASCMARS